MVNVWHRCSCNLNVKFLPDLWHITNWLRAERASILEMFLHLLQTVLVNGVPTRQDNYVVHWLKQILKANRAVMVHCSFYAGMSILQKNWVAASAFVAVKEILLAANSTDTAAIAVILFLWYIVIEQLARLTKIFCHAYTTVDANLPNLLLSATESTYDLSDLVAWNIMSLFMINTDIVLCLIMTMTTVKYLIATWSSYAAPSSIMRTSVLREPFIQQFLLRIFHMIYWFFNTNAIPL